MLRSLLDGFIELIFPTSCFACQEYEPLQDHLLCYKCLEELPWIAKGAAESALRQRKFSSWY